jgi:hypothetical protein
MFMSGAHVPQAHSSLPCEQKVCSCGASGSSLRVGCSRPFPGFCSSFANPLAIRTTRIWTGRNACVVLRGDGAFTDGAAVEAGLGLCLEIEAGTASICCPLSRPSQLPSVTGSRSETVCLAASSENKTVSAATMSGPGTSGPARADVCVGLSMERQAAAHPTFGPADGHRCEARRGGEARGG